MCNMKHGGVIVKGVWLLLSCGLIGCKSLSYTQAPSSTEFIVLDIETTGLSSKNDRIIEIGVVAVSAGIIVDSRSWLINPDMTIPSRATDVHGITNADVEAAPFFPDIYQSFMSYIRDLPLAAHNASFEKRFMASECKRHDLPSLENQLIDTLKIFRRLYPDKKTHRLSALATELTSGESPNHRGEQDARVLAELLINADLGTAENLLTQAQP